MISPLYGYVTGDSQAISKIIKFAAVISARFFNTQNLFYDLVASFLGRDDIKY